VTIMLITTAERDDISFVPGENGFVYPPPGPQELSRLGVSATAVTLDVWRNHTPGQVTPGRA
jgi:hypothetical protein